MKNALIGTLALAAIATFGDWVWATFLSRHIMAAGLVLALAGCTTAVAQPLASATDAPPPPAASLSPDRRYMALMDRMKNGESMLVMPFDLRVK